MTSIYIVRHGQSLGNVGNIFLGHTDWELSEIGKKQAECVKEFFENLKIDAIYSSDLCRAVQTILPTADKKGLEIICRENLRELYAGKWEMLSFEQIESTYPEMWNNWKKADGEKIRTPDGESIAEITHRIFSEILEIAKENDGKTIIIATHAMAIRSFTNLLLKRSLKELCDTPWVSNASVSHIVYENGEFKIDFLNNTEHLGSIVTAFPKGV